MSNNMATEDIIFQYITEEKKRQSSNLELIASENYVSQNVLKAQGSILTNKYAEGYPGARYYGGCENVDKIEAEAIERLKKLFNAAYANVQAHSGSQANAAVYYALLKPGDVILGMSLDAGGHLTHGYNINFSGKYYRSYSYGVSKKTNELDYKEIKKMAQILKPKLIVAGASAYPRIIDFKKFSAIAKEVGAYLLVDMAHIAGLVAAGLHPSPLPYADVVTSTTHKTLRGPRGGIILTNNEEIAKKIDKAIFPGIQGGPLMHVIAAKAIAFGEALSKDFIEYQKQVVNNAKALALNLTKMGYRIITGGTDNHLLLVDIKSKLNITGLEAENILAKVNITVNKNAIPFDTEPPKKTSGIRIGTPAITSLGMREEEMKTIAQLIDRAFKNKDEENTLKGIKDEVVRLLSKFKNVR